MHHIRLHKN